MLFDTPGLRVPPVLQVISHYYDDMDHMSFLRTWAWKSAHLAKDQILTRPSAAPVAKLTASSDCDSVACGCHATPPILSE